MKNKKKKEAVFIRELRSAVRDICLVSEGFILHKRRFGLSRYEKDVFGYAIIDIMQAYNKLLWLAVTAPETVKEKVTRDLLSRG